jgi:hypothetical protein
MVQKGMEKFERRVGLKLRPLRRFFVFGYGRVKLSQLTPEMTAMTGDAFMLREAEVPCGADFAPENQPIEGKNGLFSVLNSSILMG